MDTSKENFRLPFRMISAQSAYYIAKGTVGWGGGELVGDGCIGSLDMRLGKERSKTTNCEMSS